MASEWPVLEVVDSHQFDKQVNFCGVDDGTHEWFGPFQYSKVMLWFLFYEIWMDYK